MGKIKLLVVIFGVVVSLVIGGNILAEEISVPYPFSPGTTIRSSEMNQNFQTVYDKVNQLQQAVEILQQLHNVGSVINGTVPLVAESWGNFQGGCGSLFSPLGGIETTSNGLKATSSNSREGVLAASNFTGNFSRSKVNIKWLVNGGGGFSYVHTGIGYQTKYGSKSDTCLWNSYVVSTKTFSTNNSYNGTLLIQGEIWYYTTIQIEHNKEYTITTSTDNYYDLGGPLFTSSSGTITDEKWEKVSAANVFFDIADTHARSSSYFVLGEVEYQINN